MLYFAAEAKVSTRPVEDVRGGYVFLILGSLRWTGRVFVEDARTVTDIDHFDV